MELIRLFTSFHGRLGRMPFATAAAALLLANLPLFALLGSPRSLDEVNAGHVAALLAFAFPHWALSVKRAHDLGRSGWWLLG